MDRINRIYRIRTKEDELSRELEFDTGGDPKMFNVAILGYRVQGKRHHAPAFAKHPDCRIVAVCDAVEAMASDRPYHRAMSLDTIVAEVKRCAGTQFDPTVAEVFLRVAAQEGGHLITNSAREVMQSYSKGGETSPVTAVGEVPAMIMDERQQMYLPLVIGQ